MELEEQMKRVRQASASLRNLNSEKKRTILHDFSHFLKQNQRKILAANAEDMQDAQKEGLSPAMLDRLKLTSERIDQICTGIENTASLEDPAGRILEERNLASGIHLQKISVPFGVIGIIYEARPNVSADCAALCLMSGNACLLKGGKESWRSGNAIVECMKDALTTNEVTPDAVMLTERISHEETERLMKANEYIDLLIPRGSKRLIRHVVETATVPVIETGAGVCHVYVDESADEDMAEKIVINAKCSRPSVCNAMETLLLNQNLDLQFVRHLIQSLKEHDVIIHGDATACSLDPDIRPADEESWYTEYNALEMNLRFVKNVQEAVDHIQKYGTHHSESIVSENTENVRYFMDNIDSACVYHNASTRFTDGFEFGLGAEIGISTQKLHARGPMGLRELNTYTYHLEGNGEIR